MQERQNSSGKDSNATAESVGKAAIGFRPPAPFASRNSSPVQRVGEAKGSLTQPTVDQSTDVPDLTGALVTELTDAKNNTVDPATARQTALNNLLTYIQTAGGEEVYPVTATGIVTEIRYVNTTGTGDLADTQYLASGGLLPATITIRVFPEAFDGSIAALYSTIRHELIHAAQRTQSPDDLATGTQSTDEYMHENSDDVGDTEEDVGKLVYPTLQAPLQEIETHIWEIEHRDETGISADATYLEATWRFIDQYVNQLITNLGTVTKASGERNDTAVDYYRGYVIRAINQLNALAATPPTGVDNGPTMATRLKNGYNAEILDRARARSAARGRGRGRGRGTGRGRGRGRGASRGAPYTTATRPAGLVIP